MNKIISLSVNDFRNIFREQVLYFMFVIAPILQFLVARFLVPYLGAKYAVIIPYYPIILMFLTLQVVGGIGFVIASMILDERDEDLIIVLRVMPLNANTFIIYRLGMAFLLTFLYGMLMILFTGLVELPFLHAVGAAFLFAFLGPIITISMAVFSSNKVEGLALYKGINVILSLPVASFFITSPIRYVFGIVPVFWSYHYFNEAVTGGNWVYFLPIAIVLNVAAVLLLARFFKQRVFS